MKKASLAFLCALMLVLSACKPSGQVNVNSDESDVSMAMATSAASRIPAVSDITDTTDTSPATTAIPSADTPTKAPDTSATSKSPDVSSSAPPVSSPPGSAVVSTRSDVRLSGRIYESSGGPWLCWSGTSVFANIKATAIQVKLRVIPAQQGSDAEIGADYVNVIIDDGAPVVLKLYNKSKDETPVYVLATGLEDKVHKVEIVKRTESTIGPIQFESFILPDGGSFAAPPEAPSRRIEFVGSSSLCGYGNEGTSSSGFKPSEENAYMAFSLITARNLNAEQHTIAVSGAGIVRDYGGSQSKITPNMYKRTITQFDSAEFSWDFSKWVPDVVVLNIADNDFGRDNTLDDGVVFKEKLKEFLSFIRSKYPNAYIVCTSGLTGASPVPKMAPFTQAVCSEFRSALNDSKVYYISLHDHTNISQDGMGGNYHPSVKTHQRIAAYLTEQLKTITGW